MSGLDLKREKKERTPEDWVFGSDSKFCLALIPEEIRDDYFPEGELQYGREDFMDCATRSPLNILEAKFNYLVRNDRLSPENHNWLVDKGYFTDSGVEFSDRFVAVNSGTTRSGNSLKAPLEAIRKQGLIPKMLLPASPDMDWESYHNPNAISIGMKKLGEEFAKRFTINYEVVYEKDFGMLLGEDMLDTAGYAWPKPIDGVYPRVKYTPNHAFMTFRNAFFCFDNYRDTDGDWIKHLARDYDFLDYGYRVFISAENVEKKSWLQSLIDFLFSWLK